MRPKLASKLHILTAGVVLAVTCTAAFGQQFLTASPVGADIVDLTNGYKRLDVVNRSQVPITAIMVIGTRTVKRSNGKTLTLRSIRFVDSMLDPFGVKTLEPGQLHSINFFGPNPPPEKLYQVSIQLKAVILADGSTWGDAKSVSVLLSRRRSAYTYQKQALNMLANARKNGTSSFALIEQLQTAQQQSVKEARTTPDKQIADATFTEVRLLVQGTNRRSNALLNFPESAGYKMDFGLNDNATNRLLLRIGKLESSKPSLK